MHCVLQRSSTSIKLKQAPRYLLGRALSDAFHIHSELVTVPATILERWAKEGMPLPGDDFAYKAVGAETPYEELNLEQPWEQFNIEHELTRKGIQKFVSDYKSTLRKAS
jgi:transaldolase